MEDIIQEIEKIKRNLEINIKIKNIKIDNNANYYNPKAFFINKNEVLIRYILLNVFITDLLLNV